MIKRSEIKRIAGLARLFLSDDEIKNASDNLTSILDDFSVIQNIDTKNIPTADDVTGLKNIARVDEAQPECLCSTEDVLRGVPDIHDNQIKVKTVF